jgi:hypothetical protein
VNYLPRLTSNHDPPDLCLLSDWDYRHEYQCLAPFVHSYPCSMGISTLAGNLTTVIFDLSVSFPFSQSINVF